MSAADTRADADFTRACAAALALGPSLARHHERVLYLLANPASPGQWRQAQREAARITAFLRQASSQGRAAPAALRGQGLPFVPQTVRFSHDALRWLLSDPRVQVQADDAGTPRLDLNVVLKLTLGGIERPETTAGMSDDDLLAALSVKPAQRLPFLVQQLARLDHEPLLKDQLFESLDQFTRITPRSPAWSKLANRLPGGTPFFHTDGLLRRFDHLALMNSALPTARALDDAARATAITVIKTTMALTDRETDPGTYLDERSLQLFDLERGLTVAFYGMVPARQLALESYVGFTLFKNGFPVAYGGAWLLGPRAHFGMNIFEPYRGGESGFMMCQLLRAYRQAYGIRFFEVDAGQFGLDNEDGIKSGAFWFYHRYGFRPLDAALAQRAAREAARIAATPGYRSSEATLIAFTGSSVGLNFGGAVPPSLAAMSSRVTALIARRFGGDRGAAEAACVEAFSARVKLPRRLDADETRVLGEVALLAEAMKVHDAPRLRALAAMVRSKPRDLRAYQRQMMRFVEASTSHR